LSNQKLLLNKNIFITGASKGLGQSLAIEFAKAGANIYFSYLSDDEGAKKTCHLIEALGTRVISFKASSINPSEMDHVKVLLDQNKIEIDILVNNAGVSQALPFPLQSPEDWNTVIQTNINSLYYVTQIFLPSMIRKRAGVILNIGSLAGEKTISAPVHYCTSKSAYRGFTASLAKEVGRYGVRVLCLAPGLLKEGVAKNLPESLQKEYRENISLQRIGDFEEVGKYATFLVSDENTYMSGISLIIDGGF
jgi:NAD(P)-dependent dehydrogenase (short-subunit alcohol dehydrogenase family)